MNSETCHIFLLFKLVQIIFKDVSDIRTFLNVTDIFLLFSRFFNHGFSLVYLTIKKLKETIAALNMTAAVEFRQALPMKSEIAPNN
jgi:hypothetical protein